VHEEQQESRLLQLLLSVLKQHPLLLVSQYQLGQRCSLLGTATGLLASLKPLLLLRLLLML
jgi:hypothetical protein